jgi:hypothetical protein
MFYKGIYLISNAADDSHAAAPQEHPCAKWVTHFQGLLFNFGLRLVGGFCILTLGCVFEWLVIANSSLIVLGGEPGLSI